MATPVPLTTLARAKAYFMGNTPEVTAADDLIVRLIRAASVFVPGYLGWTGVAERAVGELRDGEGGNSLLLREAPVLSITSLSISDQAIAATGYVLSPIRNAELQTLTLKARGFPARVKAAIMVAYQAGFVVPAEAHTIVVNETVAVADAWIADGGVTNTGTGVALTRVDSSPAAGQYSVDAEGTYSFSDDDAGDAIAIRYSYVPADIEEVVIEMVGDWFKRRDRIGQTSQTIGAQTVAFSQREIPPHLLSILNRYKRVAPI